MAAPSIFADVDRLRSASSTYRAAGGELAAIGRRVTFVETPPMPFDISASVGSTLAQVGWELLNLEGRISNDAEGLDRNARLFEASQRVQIASPAAFPDLWAAVRLLDRLDLLQRLTAGAPAIGGFVSQAPGATLSSIASVGPAYGRLGGPKDPGRHEALGDQVVARMSAGVAFGYLGQATRAWEVTSGLLLSSTRTREEGYSADAKANFGPLGLTGKAFAGMRQSSSTSAELTSAKVAKAGMDWERFIGLEMEGEADLEGPIGHTRAQVRAMAGYEGHEALGASVGPAGVSAGASFDEFIGGGIDASLTQSISGVSARATGSVRYGLGVEAEADVDVTWSKVRLRAELGVTFGLGGSLGVDASIDLEKTYKDIQSLSQTIEQAFVSITP